MIDPQFLGLALLVAAVALIGFLAARFVGEAFARPFRSSSLDDDKVGVLVKAANGKNAHGGKSDRGFAQVVRGAAIGISPEQALGWIILLGVLLGGGLYLWRGDPLTALFGFALGTALVLAIFLLLQHRLRQQMQDQLPDVLYLLARSLRAGLSLEQAVELVGQQGPQPLADEFKRCSGQIQLGLPVVIALESMAQRLQLLDAHVFASTVAIFVKSGGNLPMLLDRVAAGARERNEFRGYLRAATALGRVTALCIAAAVPLILLVYLFVQPEYSQNFLRMPAGAAIAAAAFLMEIVGLVWIYRILKIDF